MPGAWSPAPPLNGTDPGAALDGSADFAVLALDAGHPGFPRGCGPLPLARCGTPEGQPVAVIGYPRGAPAGLIATARLTGGGGPCPDWVQLDGLQTTGAAVERGFSGAAVWDPARRRVIGLVTSAYTDRTAKVAWMLPVEAAVRLWQPLAGAVRAPARRPCTPPPLERQYELADALLDIPQIGYDSGRTLRDALPPAVRRNIRDHAWPRQQLQAVVEGCTDQPDGCPALRSAVLTLGGGSSSALRAVALLDGICCAGGPGSEDGA
ncbi:trypsin-like peptidase domain-containing protein [Streptomyces sp. NPDC004609]|uniref:effector-associated domain 2-containing protein n=1 Tax=Streptomyces sp. NPDC004609 TaxID=3364704 RepID=UPI00369B3FBE